MNSSVVKEIIDGYTRESGVRTLEREIATICRRVAREILEKDVSKISITAKNLEDYLGPVRVTHDKANKKNEIGIPEIAIVRLQPGDVVRHELVQAIVEAYEKSERKKEERTE